MDRSLDVGQLQPAYEPPAIDYATALNRVYAQISPLPTNPTPDAANEFADGCEPSEAPPASDDELPPIEHWKPIEPQYCKAIADHYQVGKRSIQKWFVELQTLAPWLAKGELRLDDDRYTPLAVELLGDRYFAGSTKKWAQRLAERFGDRTATAQTPAIRPEVLPRSEDMPPQTDFLPGLNLHLGSSLTLPAIAGVIPAGDDAAYLNQAQQKLQQFAQVKQQVITQMQQNYQETQACNAQHQEALSVSDQLFLQEFQLKGVQIGYAALQMKQEAIRATIQAAEAGTLPMPGKPQPDSAPAQSP